HTPGAGQVGGHGAESTAADCIVAHLTEKSIDSCVEERARLPYYKCVDIQSGRGRARRARRPGAAALCRLRPARGGGGLRGLCRAHPLAAPARLAPPWLRS